MSALGLTVYSCEPDEAAMFDELSPRFGILPATTSAPVSEQSLAMSGHRCISVGHRSSLSAPLLFALQERGVEYVSTRSIGLDHIDLDAAASAGITVENVTYAPDGVADYTLMLILMALRDANASLRAVAQHDFRLASTRGNEVRDMTVGVVGVGRIGNAVISRLQGFGCRILAYDKGGDDVAPQRVSLHALLRESDIVTLHLPLSTETFHLIGPAQLDVMKPGAILVNTGRGALVDTAALSAALETGALGGAALDVLEGEDGLFSVDCRRRAINHPRLLRLLAMPNVIVTPHTAYYTRRALYDTVEQTLIKARNFERRRVHA